MHAVHACIHMTARPLGVFQDTASSSHASSRSHGITACTATAAVTATTAGHCQLHACSWQLRAALRLRSWPALALAALAVLGCSVLEYRYGCTGHSSRATSCAYHGIDKRCTDSERSRTHSIVVVSISISIPGRGYAQRVLRVSTRCADAHLRK